MSKIETKKKSFLDFLFNGLKTVDSGLGDRSTYIGASDIGGCLKKAYLSKKEAADFSLEQMIVLQRGHIAEGIVEAVFKASYPNYRTQVEVCGQHAISFVKAHIDFVAYDKNECVIIETKTVSSAIDAPYESWIYQIQLQMGLLRLIEKRPIRGKIVVLNLNDGFNKEFVFDYNEAFFNAAIGKAITLWDAMQNGVEPEGECGALCSYCPFKGKCPTLRAGATELPAEIAQKVARLKELGKQEKEIKALKDDLKTYLEAAGTKKATAGENTVMIVSAKGRETVDIAKLREVAPDLYEECKTVGDGYSYLKVA